ncbi:hypothetical protein OH686_20635 [Pseudomonas sp. SO81]|nr:hypothetical protein OH686_20635 [Pseudomonas sp. SO81]
MASASTTGTTGTATSARTGSSRLASLGRVDAGFDGGLQLFYVSQIAVGRSGRRLLLGLGRLAIAPGQHLLVEAQAAVAPEGKDLTVGEGDRDRACRAGFQLLAGIHPIAFD